MSKESQVRNVPAPRRDGANKRQAESSLRQNPAEGLASQAPRSLNRKKKRVAGASWHYFPFQYRARPVGFVA